MNLFLLLDSLQMLIVWFIGERIWVSTVLRDAILQAPNIQTDKTRLQFLLLSIARFDYLKTGRIRVYRYSSFPQGISGVVFNHAKLAHGDQLCQAFHVPNRLSEVVSPNCVWQL